jgi:hypothetical protein
MKNIHLIPTDKPSRLCINGKNQMHIYITNLEEIKDGWIYDRMMRTVNKIDNVYSSYSSKIILTTDPDLIKDGVQAIDDEFLEWFVKNPSCESVNVEKLLLCTYCGQEHCDNLRCRGYKDSLYYKIIIPKEEPKCLTKLELAKNIAAIGIGKEEPKQIKCYCGHTITCDCEPKQETLTYTEAAKKEERIFNSTIMSKQETLEEAAENSALKHFLFPKELFFKMCKCSQNDYLLEEEFGLDNTTKYREILGFIKGAKWQQERMYSEEDMIEFYLFCITELLSSKSSAKSPKELFEQFKKK